MPLSKNRERMREVRVQPRLVQPDTLEQPSPLRIVPSVATGGAAEEPIVQPNVIPVQPRVWSNHWGYETVEEQVMYPDGHLPNCPDGRYR